MDKGGYHRPTTSSSEILRNLALTKLLAIQQKIKPTDPMPLPANLDSTDIAILKAIATSPGIFTREIERIVYLSRTHVLRRLRQLEERGLIVFEDGTPGQPYRYMLTTDVTPEEISQFENSMSLIEQEPVAREVSNIILQGLHSIADQLAEIAIRIENTLK